jgi:nucleoside-diphosphate-sugar epimerase
LTRTRHEHIFPVEMTFLRGKRILVTGGTGHLGSALIHYLVGGIGHDPSSIRVFYLAGTPVQSLRDIAGLDLFPGNVLDRRDVERVCDGVHYVFHMAGSTTFDPRQKRLQWLINVEGTRNVLEAVRRSPTIKRMCYTSTVNVLGVPNPAGSIGNFENSDPYTSRPQLHTFRSPEETLSFVERVHGGQRPGWEKRIRLGYFDSKLAAQELVQRYVHDYNLDVVSVLPGTSFGPYDALVGNGIYMLNIYRGRMPGILRGGISAAHVVDVAEGHLLAAASGRTGSRFIITGAAEDNLFLKDMAGTIAEVLRERYPKKRIRRPRLVVPSRLAYAIALVSEMVASITREPCLLSRAAVKAGSVPLFYSYEAAARDLGYQPKRTFRQAIEEMAVYYEKEGLFAAKGRQMDQILGPPNLK